MVHSMLRHNRYSVYMNHLNRIRQIIPTKNDNKQRTVTNATTVKDGNQSSAIKKEITRVKNLI